MLRGLGAAGSAVMVMLWATAASAQIAKSVEADAIAFGTRESVRNMGLSPDGKQAVFVGPGPGRSTIAYHVDIAAGSTRPILKASGNPERLQWCEFASDRRVVCGFYAMVQGPGFLLPSTRTISLNPDGSDIKELGQRASDYDVGFRQTDGSVIDWLPGGTDDILMSRLYLAESQRESSSNVVRTKEGIGVVRVDTRTLKSTQVEPARRQVGSFFSDGRGNIRLQGVYEITGTGQLTGRTKYQYRLAGSRDWRDLVPYQEDEFVPLAVDADLDALYALRRKEGRYVLVRTGLKEAPSETLVASHPKVDIDDVVRSANGQKIIGYTLAEDRRHVVYFDPESKGLSGSLGRALPKLAQIDLVDSSDDGSKVLVHAGSDNDAGRYFLFDKVSKQLGQLLPSRPELEGRTLASVKSINYAARDGVSVPAYLTLPPGKDSARGLPAVILPHGGPAARDEWGFDWLPQFFAAQGYAVIQPNFRGSAGYGEAWQNENGFKNWRTAINDIVDAGRHLAKAGIADPERMAIVGWSYGGYAALQSAATEPGMFKAVVAIAPVTDLPMLRAQFDDYTTGQATRRWLGTGAFIKEGSPSRQASRIQAPVLLVHGDMDLNVAVAQSQRMDSALKGAGKRSDLIIFKGLDHQLEDNDARALMLARAATLLGQTIGTTK